MHLQTVVLHTFTPYYQTYFLTTFMRVSILIMAMVGFLALGTSAQTKTEGVAKTPEKKTSVEVSPSKTSSSKELRQAEKIQGNQTEMIGRIKTKIKDLEHHIKQASNDPDYNLDAANARLKRLKEELAKRQSTEK